MHFTEILQRCKGQKVVVNGSDERLLLEVAEDFIVLQGGNSQVKITEFIPCGQVVRVTRMDYASGATAVSLDYSPSVADRGAD